MKQPLEVLLKKVFWSSVASLSALHGEAKVVPQVAPEDETATQRSKEEKKIPLNRKFILKLYANDQAELLSHRSHRSHSSHRSHYSHYSSSSGSSNSGSGSSSGSSSGYSAPSTTVPSPPSPAVPTSPRSSPFSLTDPSSKATSPTSATVSYKLGDRVLKRGMTGTDVTELANILIRKSYLFLKDGSTTLTGETYFDEVLEDALKKFQLKQAISPDGQVNPLTLYYLNH